MYVFLFNGKGLNLTRTIDITAEQMTDILMSEAMNAIDAGQQEAATFWDRDIDIKECDLETELMEFYDAIEDAWDVTDLHNFISRDDSTVKTVEKYFTCDNEAFAICCPAPAP